MAHIQDNYKESQLTGNLAKRPDAKLSVLSDFLALFEKLNDFFIDFFRMRNWGHVSKLRKLDHGNLRKDPRQ